MKTETEIRERLAEVLEGGPPVAPAKRAKGLAKLKRGVRESTRLTAEDYATTVGPVNAPAKRVKKKRADVFDILPWPRDGQMVTRSPAPAKRARRKR